MIVRPLLVALILIVGLSTEVEAKDSALVTEAKEAVKAQLLDPESAQFKIEIAKDHRVCGQVNAKNRMGGYNGFQRFMYSAIPGGKKTAMIGDSNASPDDQGAAIGNILITGLCDDLAKPAK